MYEYVSMFFLYTFKEERSTAPYTLVIPLSGTPLCNSKIRLSKECQAKQ